MQKYPEISILWYPLRFCHTHFSYHFHVIDKRIAMLPSFSTSAINTRRFNFLTSIQIRQCFSKHLNCIVHKGSLSLKKKEKMISQKMISTSFSAAIGFTTSLAANMFFLYLFFSSQTHFLESFVQFSRIRNQTVFTNHKACHLSKNYIGRWILRGTYINNLTVRV